MTTIVKSLDNANLYYTDFVGYYSMSRHDREENALKRWFDNYKIERYASFATEYECLVVSEVPSTSKRRGKRYHCDIIDEGRGTSREVIMDHTAPEPPTIFFAAKRKYEPPPPKSAEEQRREAEYDRMYRRGYEPYNRPVYPKMPRWDDGDIRVAMRQLEYITEWRMRSVFADATPKQTFTPPPAPKHRRNV